MTLLATTKVVVSTAAHRPGRDCADMDLHHEAHTNFQRILVHIQ